MKEKSLEIISTSFIIGLVWYISINLNIVVFLPMFILFFYFKGPLRIDKTYLYTLLAVISIFLFWSLLNITLYDNYDDFMSTRFLKGSVFGTIIIIFLFFFYGNRKELFLRSIENALWVMVLLWFMQFIVYYTTGEYIDLLEPIAGSDRVQRYQAYWIKDALPIDLIRPTSIFIEPGTYAVNTLPLMILSYIERRKITKLHILVLFSYFASISLFAIIVGTLFIVIAQISTFKFKLSKKNIFLFFFFSTLIVLVGLYLYYRFILQGGTDQVSYREDVIGYWFEQDSLSFLLGQGAAQIVVKRVMVEDASFLFMLIFEYGAFALPYLTLLLYLSWGLPTAFLLIILLTKLNYSVYTMWLYIAGLAILRNYRLNKE